MAIISEQYRTNSYFLGLIADLHSQLESPLPNLRVYSKD